MRILFTHRYYWPSSSPYGAILREIAKTVAVSGHDVSVFCGSTAEEIDTGLTENSISVIPTKMRYRHESGKFLRAMDAVIYSLRLFFHILFCNAEIVVAATYPPVLAAWCASFACTLKKIKFVYHIQDIHPDISELINQEHGSRILFRFLRLMDNQSLKRAHAIVTLSNDMADTIRARGSFVKNVQVINNFSVVPQLNFEVSAPIQKNRKRIIFAGNLGRFQNLPKVVRSIATILKNRPDLELLMLGSGILLKELNAEWGSNSQIKFMNHLPLSSAAPLIAASDIGVVSLTKGMFRLAYPSKHFTYISLGVRILGFVESESVIAQDIIKYGSGVVCDVEDKNSVTNAIDKVLNSPQPSQIILSKENTRDFIIEHWLNLFGTKH